MSNTRTAWSFITCCAAGLCVAAVVALSIVVVWPRIEEQFWLWRVRSGSVDQQRFATQRLVELRSAAAVTELVRILKTADLGAQDDADPATDRWAFAVEAIARLGGSDGLLLAASELAVAPPEIEWMLNKCWFVLPEEPAIAGFFLGMLKDRDEAVRRSAGLGLALFGPCSEHVKHELTDAALHDTSQLVRSEILRGVGDGGCDAGWILWICTRLLHDPDPELRYMAVRNVGYTAHDPRLSKQERQIAVDAMTDLLRNPDEVPEVQGPAQEVLQELTGQ